MRTLALTYSTCLLAALAGAQENPGHTLDGWAAVRWGMTVAQARNALGPEATISTVTPGPNFQLIDRLTLPVTVGSLAGSASVQTPRDADRVTAVTLLFGDVSDPTASRAHAYDELKRLLMEKYGAPRDDQSRSIPATVDRIATWTFPRTTVTLAWRESRARVQLGSVTITYRAVDPKTKDVL